MQHREGRNSLMISTPDKIFKRLHQVSRSNFKTEYLNQLSSPVRTKYSSM